MAKTRDQYITIKEIRGAYPSPTKASDSSVRKGYCVGGACLGYCKDHASNKIPNNIFLHEERRKHGLWPDDGELARAMEYVSGVSRHDSRLIAEKVIALNDNGFFKQAWKVADEGWFQR